MAKRKRYTYQDIKNIVENENYELISKEDEIIDEKGFVKTSIKITVWCKNENHSYKTPQLSNFINGHRCRECSNDNMKYKYEYIKEYIESFGYKLISKEYINARIKLEVECPESHKYKSTFDNFKHGYRCPYCYGNVKYKYEYIKEYIESFGYKLISKEYINVFNKLEVECPKGHRYKVNFNNFQNGYRCPICNQSSGEQEIFRILEKYNITYIPQHKFKNCVDKNELSFDFYIPLFNIIVEFDGKQHFEVVNFNNDEECIALEKFNLIKKHDNIKTQYCKNNNIKLIRIPYWDFNNIENILIKELNLK